LDPALIHAIHAGDQVNVNETTVTVTRSSHLPTPLFSAGGIDPRWHFPLTARQYRMDETLGFLIKAGDFRILTAPGTDMPHDMPIDILMINPLHSARYLEGALNRFPARVVIPSHWDVFWQPLEQPIRPMIQPIGSIRRPLQKFRGDSFRAFVQKIHPDSIVLIPERMDEICLNDYLPDTISPGRGSSPASQDHP
jgi:L-ascorbate metabolism protein UlaG (beta-lactamase superfamily)